MYQKFFGFQRAPFELVPDPDFLFLGESHDAALANLIVGIESGKGFVAISGPVGTGKTTILRALLRRLGRGEKVCFLSQPELDTGDLLFAILNGFGIHADGEGVADLRRALRETMQSSDVPGILIIDEAHLLSVDALEQIRLLSNLEEDDRKLLQIILAGQPELKMVLSSERLRPLAQRIEMFYELRALDRADTHGYIERRMRIAGNPDALDFDTHAKDMIHDCTGGIPRLINVLADRALITAYVGESRHISEEIVADAYEDLGEISQAVMPGSPHAGRRSVRRPRVLPIETQAPAPPIVRAPPETHREPEPMVTETANQEIFSAQPPRPPRGSRPPRPPRPPRRPMDPVKRDRWLAGVGIAAIAVLAAVSLGSRYLRTPAFADPVAGTLAPAPAAVDSTAAQPAAVSPPAEPQAQAEIPPPTTQAVPSVPVWGIQVASFRSAGRAARLAAQLRRETGEVVSVAAVNGESGIWHRVVVGTYESRQEVARRMEELRATYDFGFLRRVRLRSDGGQR